MHTETQIQAYIDSQLEPKRTEIEALHGRILGRMPGCKLWFFDGKDETGKVIANAQIGYGQLTMHYADGKQREFYQIGLSGNTAGISIYVMGLEDKHYLSETYGNTLGKAKITGYCIKFKRLMDIHPEVLDTAIADAVSRTK